jgi:hypothetical protein
VLTMVTLVNLQGFEASRYIPRPLVTHEV